MLFLLNGKRFQKNETPDITPIIQNETRSKILALFAATRVNHESRVVIHANAIRGQSIRGGPRNFRGKMLARDTLARKRGEFGRSADWEDRLLVASVVYRSFCHRLAVNRRLTLENQSATVPCSSKQQFNFPVIYFRHGFATGPIGAIDPFSRQEITRQRLLSRGHRRSRSIRVLSTI